MTKKENQSSEHEPDTQGTAEDEEGSDCRRRSRSG